MEVEGFIAKGDLIVGHYTMSGSHLGKLVGAAPRGKTFSIESIDIVRTRDGRIAEHWGLIDDEGMARQPGLSA